MCCHWAESALTERHIDLDLLNDKIVLSKPTGNFQISDHSFIHTHIFLPKPKISRGNRKVRNFRHIKATQFLNDIIQFNENATTHN